MYLVQRESFFFEDPHQNSKQKQGVHVAKSTLPNRIRNFRSRSEKKLRFCHAPFKTENYQIEVSKRERPFFGLIDDVQ